MKFNQLSKHALHIVMLVLLRSFGLMAQGYPDRHSKRMRTASQ
jgi:hypothetical protein